MEPQEFGFSRVDYANIVYFYRLVMISNPSLVSIEEDSLGFLSYVKSNRFSPFNYFISGLLELS